MVDRSALLRCSCPGRMAKAGPCPGRLVILLVTRFILVLDYGFASYLRMFYACCLSSGTCFRRFFDGHMESPFFKPLDFALISLVLIPRLFSSRLFHSCFCIAFPGVPRVLRKFGGPKQIEKQIVVHCRVVTGSCREP